MISKIKIKNFKSLREVELELKPLTILVGPNASGKSSVIEAITFLKQSVGEWRPTFNGRYVQLEDFEKAVYRSDARKWMTIEVSYRLSEEDLNKLGVIAEKLPQDFKADKYGDACYRADIREDEIKQSISTEKFVLITGQFMRRGTLASSFITPKILRPVKVKSPSRILSTEAFEVGPDTKTVPVDTQFIIDFGQCLRGIIAENIAKTYYISVLRGDPAVFRSTPFFKELDYVGAKGEDTLVLMAYILDLTEADELPERVYSTITKWADEFGLNELLIRWGKPVSFTDPQIETVIPLLAAGHGSRQILPVIIQLFWSKPNSTVLIEEPEISLHPDAQVKLPEMFAEAIKEEKQVIVTTHSQILLLALRPLIAKGSCSHNDVAIYHFGKTRLGASVCKLEITPEGIVKDWVPSFAEAELKLVKGWIETVPEAE